MDSLAHTLSRRVTLVAGPLRADALSRPKCHRSLKSESMSRILRLYQTLSKFPLGKFIFMRGVEFNAPYFKSIRAQVLDYRPGFAQFMVKDRRRVHNHIGTVHAIALCNLAELCGALTVDSVTPAQLRWIPQGMSVKYVAKAKGDITGTCELTQREVQPGVVTAPIVMRDPQGQIVMTADIDFYVSAKK